MLLVFAIVGMQLLMEPYPDPIPTPTPSPSPSPNPDPIPTPTPNANPTPNPNPNPNPAPGMQLYMGEFRQRCYDPLSGSYPEADGVLCLPGDALLLGGAPYHI